VNQPDSYFLSKAVKLAGQAASKIGCGPFAAIIVFDGEEVSFGINRVVDSFDPTAHAEVVAIRKACEKLKRFSLAGCTLYTSCEPCPMCLSAAIWARIDRIVYAATRNDAAEAGFDDAEIYQELSLTESGNMISRENLQITGASQPFDIWLANQKRIPY